MPAAAGLHACGLHAAKLVLELADLIADPRGKLELKLRCRGMHLLGELGDQRCQVGASRAAPLSPAAAAAAARALEDTPGTGAFPRLCCRPEPPSSCSVSASSLAS